LVMSELSGGTTIEVRAPVVTTSVGSPAETAERTAMALDGPSDREQSKLPGVLPGSVGGETPDNKPTGVQT